MKIKAILYGLEQAMASLAWIIQANILDGIW
jgi:hypothetical protein